MMEDNKFKCTICEKEYASMSSLCNHSRNIHSLTSRQKKPKNIYLKELQDKNDVIDTFKCDYCDSVYKHRQSKTKHMRKCEYKKANMSFNTIQEKIINLETHNIKLDKQINTLEMKNIELKNELNKMKIKNTEVENILIKLNGILKLTQQEENDDLQTIQNHILKLETRNKKHVPKLLKNQSWDVYIGKEKGVGNCFCCNTEIDSKHFECGHVIPISKGGPDTIENLRLICSLCNRSMGSKNMAEFMKKYLNKQFNPII